MVPAMNVYTQMLVQIVESMMVVFRTNMDFQKCYKTTNFFAKS